MGSANELWVIHSVRTEHRCSDTAS
jgi:hypothetical protein